MKMSSSLMERRGRGVPIACCFCMEANPLPTNSNYQLAGDEAADTWNEVSPATLRFQRERLPIGREPVRPLRHRWYLSCKHAADFALAALLTVPAVPLIFLAALVVRLTSRGPAFYTQTRVGMNGRLFTIWKIRSMIHNCESLTGARWSMPGDPRVTRVGAFLRASHLDELPQLLNVLQGEMSLIGPRPERPEFVPELERELPGYWQRLAVRPGVTGLAQVQLPPDSDLTSVRRKLAHDLFYIRHLSPWLDVRLLFCTAFYAFGLPFGIAGKLLGIPDGDTVEEAMDDVLGDMRTPRARLSA
jgi:lipopolysaccharide/colanic/teichoic acid biosynthesis glycosyltransferase